MRPAKAGRIFYSLQAAARIICPPMAGKFHTCGLRGIFRYAQVAAENDLNLFRRGAAKLCEAFWGAGPLAPL